MSKKETLIGTRTDRKEFRGDGVVGKINGVAKFTPGNRSRAKAHMPKKERNR